MKNKLRIYMLIASLFMCCGVIGFGIYAATLGVKIPGSLGYDGASNVITVAMAVEDVAEYNGTTQIGKITKTFSETYLSSSPTLQLGSSISDLYFYNDGTKNKDMVFKVTVGNVSTSKRLVTLNDPTSSLPSGVTVSTASHFITFPLQTYMNAGESKTFMFGLTYSGTGKYQLISGSMSINTSVDTSTASTLFQHETNFGWYATMGTNPYSDYNEPLRWMPIASYNGIAKTGDKSTTAGSNAIGTLNSAYSQVIYKGLTNCPTIGQSYYLLSEYVLDTKKDLNQYLSGLSYNFCQGSSEAKAGYFDGTSWIFFTDVDGNNYSVSNIRAYLTGSRTAYQTYDQIKGTYTGKTGSELSKSFEEQFNVQNSALYNNIVARSQNNLCVLAQVSGMGSIANETFEEKIIQGKSTNTLDKFWALSYNEWETFLTNSLGYNLTGSGAGEWWFRSPYADYKDGVMGADSYGSFFIGEQCFNEYGVRPAVQVACSI